VLQTKVFVSEELTILGNFLNKLYFLKLIKIELTFFLSEYLEAFIYKFIMIHCLQ